MTPTAADPPNIWVCPRAGVRGCWWRGAVRRGGGGRARVWGLGVPAPMELGRRRCLRAQAAGPAARILNGCRWVALRVGCGLAAIGRAAGSGFGGALSGSGGAAAGGADACGWGGGLEFGPGGAGGGVGVFGSFGPAGAAFGADGVVAPGDAGFGVVAGEAGAGEGFGDGGGGGFFRGR